MRLIVLGVCLLAAACGGQTLSSPASPAKGGMGSDQTESGGATALPFRGSFTTVTDVPPPSAHATAEGTASHLGRFTGAFTANVNPDSTATGTFNFIAENGDQLSGTFTGQGTFIPPNTARITELATIQSGTGRFAGATGTFTMTTVDTIDLATGRATGEGTFEGRINLNK